MLVRYNPEGEAALNQLQASRLKRLSDYLHQSQRLFMFELLVPPELMQLDQVEGDKHAYDLQLRPRLMMQAIQALQAAGWSRMSGRSKGLIAGKMLSSW